MDFPVSENLTGKSRDRSFTSLLYFLLCIVTAYKYKKIISKFFVGMAMKIDDRNVCEFGLQCWLWVLKKIYNVI